MVWHPHQFRVNKYRRICHGIQSYSKLHYTGQRWNNRSTWHGYEITSANAIMVEAGRGWCRGYRVRHDWRETESAGCRDSARPRLSGGQQKLAMLVVRRQIHLSRANGQAEFWALLCYGMGMAWRSDATGPTTHCHWPDDPLVRKPIAIGPTTHWHWSENPLVRRPIGPKKCHCH